MLLDSNIIIYAAQPQREGLRQFIAEHGPAVSLVSYVETLGYHRLNGAERQFLVTFFEAAEILPISRAVAEQAISLRQVRRMSLGDALIAGTALVHKRPLVTHNSQDFDWISDLAIIDPIASLE
ncbi:MAG: type II toxin-antitoxin system VapC family toxin [Cyanobacteria bacterium]|nr:type II toxin-antitoxin system VapC family toxin [Cyanobacteriota bacterium]MDA0865196.1 type II toxin-antitoxin system VapC family toxin [Cyanobacteriota bacterium]